MLWWICTFSGITRNYEGIEQQTRGLFCPNFVLKRTTLNPNWIVLILVYIHTCVTNDNHAIDLRRCLFSKWKLSIRIGCNLRDNNLRTEPQTEKSLSRKSFNGVFCAKNTIYGAVIKNIFRKCCESDGVENWIQPYIYRTIFLHLVVRFFFCFEKTKNAASLL